MLQQVNVFQHVAPASRTTRVFSCVRNGSQLIQNYRRTGSAVQRWAGKTSKVDGEEAECFTNVDIFHVVVWVQRLPNRIHCDDKTNIKTAQKLYINIRCSQKKTPFKVLLGKSRNNQMIQCPRRLKLPGISQLIFFSFRVHMIGNEERSVCKMAYLKAGTQRCLNNKTYNRWSMVCNDKFKLRRMNSML